jgi:hypothetical protein
MVHEGNIHDTAVILLATLRQAVAGEDIEMKVLKRMNDMYRFCTRDFRPIGEVGRNDFEAFKRDALNELGAGATDEDACAVLKEMFEMQKQRPLT